MLKKVNIDDIYLDGQNPRLKKEYDVEKQELILNEIIDSQGDKFFNIVKDISIRGELNPIDKIAFLRENNRYIVVEGNRRIAALKVLFNNEIIKYVNFKLFSKINKLEPKESLKVIEGVVFDSREEANEWIMLRHTGENNGAGVVPWTSENKRLFEERITGKKNMLTLFLEEYLKKSKLKKETLDLLPKIKITNLERILGDKKVKENLKIMLTPNKADLNFSDIELLDKIMSDLIHRNPNVEEIYNKDRRIKYLEKIKNGDIKSIEEKKDEVKELFKFKDDNTFNENEEEIKGNNNNNNLKKSKNEDIINLKMEDKREGKRKVFAEKRKTLIPEYFYIPKELNIPKIRNLCIELKECKLDEYPVIIGCVFRIFLELTLDYYLKSKGINMPEKKSKLTDKLRRVLIELKDSDLIKEADSINLENLSTNKESILSISSFNGVVHGNYVLDTNILITAWDNYEIIFNAIYFNKNV